MTMSFHSWLQNLRSALALGRGQRHHGRRGSLRAATHRLHLEPLEDRRLLAFIAPVDYAVSNPFALVPADFNGDGNLDLATASFSNEVSVLMGNADGAFQGPQSYAVGSFGSIAVGDFNGDG